MKTKKDPKKKRNARSYKTTDQVYKKAMVRAKKEKVKLAVLVESVVTSFSDGNTILY